jgi:hypothetical protein
MADLRHQMDDRWPNLGRRLATVIRVSREKLGDIYCSAAEVVTEHKEAFEDRIAEKKAQARAATRATQQKGASGRPIRHGVSNTVKDGTVKHSAARLPATSKRAAKKSRS